MVRTTIGTFSLDSEAGPYLYVCVCLCVRASYKYAPCVVCVCVCFSWIYQYRSIMQPTTLKQIVHLSWFCERTHCWGVWLSCVCQNELTSQTTGSLNVMAIFIQPWHTVCLALSDPISEWGLECHQREPKLGQAQMDRLLYRLADMSLAAIVLCKWPPVCHCLSSAIVGWYQRWNWFELKLIKYNWIRCFKSRSWTESC